MSFFVWIAARGGILTINNLVKRGQSLVNRCCLCCCDGEFVDHLLRKFALAFWSEVFNVISLAGT